MSLIINPHNNLLQQHIFLIPFFLLVGLIEVVSDNVSKRFIFISAMCMTVLWVWACVWGSQGSQIRASDALKLQMIVNSFTWVLETRVDSLQEQHVLFIAELSVLHTVIVFMGPFPIMQN